MELGSLDHVGVRTVDRARMETFYVGVLGLVPHPVKTNWLTAADGSLGVHLMPGTAASHADDSSDNARHFALATRDLEGVVDELIAAGYSPYQAELTGTVKVLPDSTDLSFGIGTVFVVDPDGNVVEFIDRNRGIFLEVLGPEGA